MARIAGIYSNGWQCVRQAIRAPDVRGDHIFPHRQSQGTASPDCSHSVGVNALFADGHIEQIKNTTSPDLLHGLLTASGGEDVGEHPYLQE